MGASIALLKHRGKPLKRIQGGRAPLHQESKMKNALDWLGRTLAVFIVVAFLAACAQEAPVGLSLTSAESSALAAKVDLGVCPDLAPPEGSTLMYHVYARGVQIYRWNGTSWGPVGPSAKLYADKNERSLVGIHYGGPSWESLSGSKVMGSVAKRCTADPTAVQWLLLDATSTEGPGVFAHVKHIQRLNTVGGIAPTYSGTVGQEVSIPYSTEYFFYRGK
jgi:hypothetical protein